jgi:Histidine kinase-like ATPase domain
MTQNLCFTNWYSETCRRAGEVEGGHCDGTPVAVAGDADIDQGSHTVGLRACAAWPLPADPTCASIARRTFRRVAAALGLDRDAADDGVTMVSELAANTLHAQCEERRQPGERRRRDQRPEWRAATPELWLYLRGAGRRSELVCKVFDSYPGWLHGNAPGRRPHRAPADAISGRGLEVVHELSRGRWGYHLTRARLAGWEVRGKAVWFAVPAAATATASPQGARSAGPAWIPAATAMTGFQEALTARGFTGRTVRADDPAADMTVLSVSGGLTVWCCSGLAWLRAPGYSSDQWRYCDLVEVAEQTVEAYESLAGVAEPALLADAARAGALRPGPVHAVRERPVGAQHDVPEPADVDIGRHERVRGD